MPACGLVSLSSLRKGVVKDDDVDEDEGSVLDFVDDVGGFEAFGSLPVVVVSSLSGGGGGVASWR